MFELRKVVIGRMTDARRFHSCHWFGLRRGLGPMAGTVPSFRLDYDDNRFFCLHFEMFRLDCKR